MSITLQSGITDCPGVIHTIPHTQLTCQLPSGLNANNPVSVTVGGQAMTNPLLEPVQTMNYRSQKHNTHTHTHVAHTSLTHTHTHTHTHTLTNTHTHRRSPVIFAGTLDFQPKTNSLVGVPGVLTLLTGTDPSSIELYGKNFVGKKERKRMAK